MLLTVFWTCVGLLAYVYVLYPPIIQVLARLFGRDVKVCYSTCAVTVIVTAYNEADCIHEKLDNLAALDYPQELLEIMVVSDGSTDATERIAERYERRAVRVLRVEGRLGKTACQNAAAAAATGEILVFTDATTHLHPGAVRALVAGFGEREIGCVGGRLEYVTDISNATGHGGEAYWSYEMRLRAAEASFSSLIGVSGCLYAVRKTAYRPIAPDLISDFAIAMKMREQHLRTILAPNACCFESTLNSSRRELAMRVRVVIRSLHALVRERRFLNPFAHGRFAWQLWSHKVFRYASPLLWIGALVTNFLLAIHGSAYLAILIAQLLVLSMGILGFLLQHGTNELGWLAKPYYFVLTNLASLIATARYLRGERMTIWTPVR